MIRVAKPYKPGDLVLKITVIYNIELQCFMAKYTKKISISGGAQ